ncbi:protein tyrosine phosphatase 69D [Choristoneura fumiferana]|uniref:protein tyrosine phosphatase 69D n=1 Tax=Choristoneura fumiferana TaxID=7141 RepID=UPI003D15DD06
MTMGHSIGKYSMIPLYVLCIALCYPVSAQTEQGIQNVTAEGAFGKEAVIKCILRPHNLTAKWLFQGADVKFGDRITQNKTEIPSGITDNDGTKVINLETTLRIANTSDADVGNYTCVAGGQSRSVILNLSYPGKLVESTKGPLRFNITEGAKPVLNLSCTFEVYNQTKVEWILHREALEDKQLEATSTRDKNNARLLKSYYTTPIFLSAFDDQNGTYICQAWDPDTLKYITGQTDVLIYALPVLDITSAIAISSSQIFFNWTVKNYNSPIKRYDVNILSEHDAGHRLAVEYRIDPKSTKYVMENLKKNTTYNVKLSVNTEFGVSKPQQFPTPKHEVRTLLKDPVFVPNISINGFSSKSMTIGLSPPPPDVAEYVHYYMLERWKKGHHNETLKVADHYRDDRNLPYMFNDLEPHSTYVFRARACSEYTKQCGEWSEEMEAVTLDGTPDKPTDVHIECLKQDGRNYMNLTWGPPAKPNAEIKGYMMEVTGNMTYINRFGIEATDTWGPLSKFMTNNSRTVRVDDLKPNTNYTVRISAMTRTRRRGLEEIAFCKTKPAPPDNPPRPKFIKHGEKVDDTIKYSLRVLVPRSSERNGPICCYRVYVVRLLPGLGWSKLPPPADLKTLDFHEAHRTNAEIGAYITDVFNNENFPKEELILGDNITITLNPVERNATCARCFVRRRLREPPRPTTPAPEEDTTADDDLLSEGGRDERSVEDDRFANDEMLKTKKSVVKDEPPQVIDGKLDPQANYTLFVELIPGTDDEPLFSGYTVALNTAMPQNALDTNTMELALKIACCVAALLLLVTLVLCVVHTRRARKMPPAHAHVELNPIQAALRYVVGHIGGRQQLVPATPPDMPPIAIEDLAAAYVARQADSDYEFQKEFELLQMLPECYPDRTCHASEARENQPKNRYPDIKAYDQTRVKLSQIDGITGSDYINANFVMGYKEHKKFICAQGPTEATVNDFWRMIWEHGLELIVMLTNLEEYSKVKCSKYWPDELRGARAFGGITVHHVAEKRYSDYIVRELKITKQPTNSEGQPIVENNGVAKRNGDCKDAESASAPTSPRENKDSNTRVVRQYHFLMWKDFAAPEHPQSILRFIKRVNEAWSGLLGRPAVVHCSAGVGRTGTLVALDCLLEQLRAERRAAVFATVADLRRQRNFLVQSLKQYVFVYRALVEYAHYGDTEIPASRLKASIDRLRNTPEGADKCLMEHEFEKILNPPVPEPVKSCAAAAVEEARARNRSQDCLPYDRNRVILTPAPPAHYCTYINASFIEAYDNSEGYIITQDPLPNTIMDFWRMVSEHNVSTIVMLSELGEGKCPRYWDDGTAQYEHISVQYEESESCPYYTRRQFRVTNNKSGDVTSVRQLQYHGWPTAPGHVPEVTRGLAELADAARQAVAPHPGSAMALHCQYGTERSALFATLCVLIAQLRTERRVDVCAAARKVRSQRAHTIDTSLQYEFLHRAILNYAELHNLLEDS